MTADKWAEYREAERRWLREGGYKTELEMTGDTTATRRHGDHQIGRTKGMAGDRPKSSALSFASFAAVPGAAPSRRGRRWEIWLRQAEGASAAMEVARLVREEDLLAALGRKKPE